MPEHDIKARLRTQWVLNLAEVVTTLIREGEAAPWPFVALFWLRLLGVFVEIRPHYRRLLADSPLKLDLESGPLPRGSLGNMVTSYREMERLRRLFSEDELIYCDYRRHTEGHPTQDSYSMRWKNDKLSEERGLKVLDGKTLKVGELDAAVRRVLGNYPSELAIALDFARRIGPEMGTLVRAMIKDATPMP